MTGASHAADAPDRDCPLCPRLAAYRADNRRALPDGYNGPVPAFGPTGARLLIVGLAPGLHGANRTGRPFTGDYAGDLLYTTLLKFGFARGVYGESADDGLELVDARITNAVRCAPPQNKPTPLEIKTCLRFHAAALAAAEARAVICLGRIAHDATLAALGVRPRAAPFAHGARHRLDDKLVLFDSYHCSRYNTNTGRLTTDMFERVFAAVRAELDDDHGPN